jgi:hypothetical protein
LLAPEGTPFVLIFAKSLLVMTACMPADFHARARASVHTAADFKFHFTYASNQKTRWQQEKKWL